MENMQQLLASKRKLRSTIQMMDRNARFDTEEGRVYAHTLVKLVMIEMQIEAQQKEKIARK
ncbi:hypothetical protein P4H70_04505 [Paenibacillus ehimensis]|uniref:hypothetical protein n=1 Tax=Paenibacillus ehimensis TaxID=79264 RepID=UPI002DBD18BF|nr:hypothetical protein [Paenibacillus ehimensis]MEC0208202.1 hypothetical protein [Paenibacillus ehimensis]